MRRCLISFLLIISIILASCQPLTAPRSPGMSFREFTDTLFCDWASCDSLTLNYTLKEPSRYNITQLPQGFAASSTNSSSHSETENMLQRLNEYEKDELPKQEQILYDTLEDYLTLELSGASYAKFADILNPSSGIQAQLPVLLAEFHLDSKEDVSQYFLLLQSVPSYFQLLVQMEKEKQTSELLPAKTTLEHVIGQCRSFLSENGCQMIKNCFNQQIRTNFPKEATELARRHDSYLEKYLIPAYKDMITNLTALLPDASADGALAAYPEGKKYYAYLFRQKSGSSETVAVWQKKLLKRLQRAEDKLLSYAAEDPSAFRTCEDYQQRNSSPESILDTLQEKMKADFPSCRSTAYELHRVDASLENYLSPAFYLTPPIDDTSNNAIYINYSPQYSRSSLFNTLAHEAYPGHLFQNCYMREQNLPLLRYLMDYPAYTEGYATYAEIYSYRYTGASPAEVGILQNNAIASHCLYALCDIGIHYDHWNKTQLSSFLGEHGISGAENTTRIYDAIIDSPGSYLPYTVGFLQIEELRQHFPSAKSFHTYLLNMGPTSFSILKKYAASEK